jgi:excisionase family DNA binding protein
MRQRPHGAKFVADLMRVTGLGRDTCRAAIRTGELPGYKVGRKYVIPAEAFDRFCKVDWQPQPGPLFREPIKPLPNLVHRRSQEGAADQEAES